jgi:hypothetical protein
VIQNPTTPSNMSPLNVPPWRTWLTG